MEHDPMAPGRTYSLPPVPRAVGRHSVRQIDVGQPTLAPLIAGDDEGALDTARPEQKCFDALEARRPPVAHEASRLALPGTRVSHPDTPSSIAPPERAARSSSSSVPWAGHAQALDRIEVPIEDSAHRAVRARHLPHQRELVGEVQGPAVGPGQGRPQHTGIGQRREGGVRELGRPVELVGSGGDAVERHAQWRRALGSVGGERTWWSAHAALSDSGTALQGTLPDRAHQPGNQGDGLTAARSPRARRGAAPRFRG